MEIVELKNGNIKLVADGNKIIESKVKHYDEETEQEVADIRGETIYLGKNDKAENYEEVEKEEKV